MNHLRLLQHRAPDGTRSVILAQGDGAHFLENVASTRELALKAIAEGRTLAETALGCPAGAPVDIAAALAAGRLIAPVDHQDPAHVLLTGTGLTHLGSGKAATRCTRPRPPARS